MLKERHQICVSMLVGIDTLVIAAGSTLVLAAGTTADLLRDWRHDPEVAAVALPLLLNIPVLLACMSFNGLYRPRRDRSFGGEIVALARAVVIDWALFVTALFAFRPDMFTAGGATRPWILLPVLLFLFLMAFRFVFRFFLRAIRERGWNLRHVAIIGTGRVGQHAHQSFARNSWTGIKTAYFVSHHEQTRRRECLGLPLQGGLAELEERLEHDPVDGVVVALPQKQAHRLPELLARLERFPVDVRIVPDVGPRSMPINLAVNDLEGMPILSLRQHPLAGYGGLVKRGIDLVGAATALLVFAFPMLVIAGLVRLEGRGPILFRQTRVGMAGRPFEILKFRTMRGDAVAAAAPPPPSPPVARPGLGDSVPLVMGTAPLVPTVPGPRAASAAPSRSAAPSSDAMSGATAVWTQPDDPRVTRIGRFLRRTSLDELPQLFNVLRGEMSLVGPRPERIDLLDHFREARPGYMLRQHIKAGMTGWAQVNGLRGATCLRKRLQYDIYYIRNWSVAFDVRILWLTIFRGFRHPNAY